MAAKVDHPHLLKNFDELPDAAAVRLPVVKAVTGMSEGTIWRLARSGKLPPLKLSERITAWRVGDLREFLAAARSEAA